MVSIYAAAKVLGAENKGVKNAGNKEGDGS
jgi:hypothetical protein